FLYCVVLASAYDDLYTYLFTDPYTPWIHSLSLHDALPISEDTALGGQAGTSSRIENYLGFPAGLSGEELAARAALQAHKFGARIDRKSTRLNSSHVAISYAVFCLKKKNLIVYWIVSKFAVT